MKPRILVLAALSAGLLPLSGAFRTGSSLAEEAAAPDPAMAALVRDLGGAGTRDAAARKLASAGEAAVPALVAVLKDEKLAEPALDVLAAMGPGAKGAVPALAPLLKQWSYPHRARTARALGSVGADASAAVPNLVAFLGESAKSAGRESAAAALASIAADDNRRARKPLPPNEVDLAITAGQDWLLRHQSADGRFDCDGFLEQCKGGSCGDAGETTYDPGVTGLAMLALLDARNPAALDAPRAAAVARAETWLGDMQDAEGCFGPRTSQHFQYNHMIATLAVVEAGGRGAGGAKNRELADKAVRFTEVSRNPYLGWRYGVADGDNDTSVTAWAIRALDAARATGRPVDVAHFRGALDWVGKMTSPDLGRTGYQVRGSAPARTLPMMDRFNPDLSESMTACGLHVRLAAWRADSAAAQSSGAAPPVSPWTDGGFVKGMARIHGCVPDRARRPGGTDLYYWMLAAPLVRTAGGPEYKRWRDGIVASLVAFQNSTPSSCSRGSWERCDPWGPEGGRIYTTAAALIALCEMREDPASRPAPTAVAKRAIAALEKGASDSAPSVADACRNGLRTVKDTCRP